MKNLSAFIVKVGQLTEIEDAALDIILHGIMEKNFTDADYLNIVFDVENNTMVAFMNAEDKYKIDAIVDAANEFKPGIVELYEDVTKKFIYENKSVKNDMTDNFVVRAFLNMNMS